MMEVLCKRALEIGFDQAKPLRIETLRPMEAVRDMCAADKCHAYGKNWTCPPACGTLEDCESRMKNYQDGILLQTIGFLRRAIDSRTTIETGVRHMKNFYAFAQQVREICPDALCLGAGGCRVCEVCAYPEPCRFPEKALSSMEGYGLFVTQVCKENDLPYHYGDKTITYTACVLFNPKEDSVCRK